MKRPLFGFRATLALLLFAAVAGVGGVFWWKYTEKEREIGRLRQAIEHLTASYPIARLVVTGQEQAPPAAATTGGAPTATAAATTTPTTHVRLWLVDDDGRRLDEAHETSLAGRRVYFEALLIVFDDPLV